MECPSCGEDFQKLGLHWWHGTCPYPELEVWQREMFIGALIGDGSIPDSRDNSVFHLPMINRTFLEWFDDAMGVMTTGVHLTKTASEIAAHSKSTGFSPNAKRENYHDIYTLWSRTHPFFNKLRGWYGTGRKRLPHDLELTPILTKLWYVSDGYLDVGQWGRPRIEIKARSEKDNAEFLLSLFRTIGLDPVYIRHEIRFTCDDTERLISWMGPPPPGFEYKWELESRERYRRLKAEAYSNHATQTFE